jgi:formylglycine-generating enzyme required for sulfatase activity
MGTDHDKSLGDAATHAGAKDRLARDEVSLGDERTFGGGDAAGVDTILEDLEIFDLSTRYRVEGTLGQGGMGAVLLATDTRLGRKVAIKRILGEAAGNRMAVSRFLTEAKAIARISHPNVVQIHELGRAADGPFLVMEYVDGGTLADRSGAGALPIEQTIDLTCQLCDGLARAHDAGIVHRDIKPANVLLTKDGIPKLTDFGLAKAEAADHRMTMTGAVMGTPDFMPPEQRRDAGLVDHRSDLWSLAATVYQMVTGRSPKVIDLRHVPDRLRDVLARALEDDKDARYQSARELRDALKTSVRAAETSPAPVVIGDLAEGTCRACGTVNTDLARKFCRNPSCGASLRMTCLSCDATMPVWEAVCGECGGNQPKIVAGLRTSLDVERSAAEARLAEFAFDEAALLAAKLAGTAVPQLADVADWGRSFGVHVADERLRQEAIAAEKLRDAEAHRSAFDYPAAIHALEAVPQPLRTPQILHLLAECQQAHEEATRLIDEISHRIKQKKIDGLLPLVERAMELRGDRKDLAKIRGQLVERRDGRLARARASLVAGDSRSAAASFDGAAAEDFEAVDQVLMARVRRTLELEAEIARLVKEAKADAIITPDEAAGILASADEYLAINPKSEQVTKLAGQCQKITGAVGAYTVRHRQAESGVLSAEATLALPPLRNSIGIELKLLPAGAFMMGEAGGDKDEIPHEVTLTKPFYIGVYEVTNAQWKRVMGTEPSKWKDADCPVETVSWDDANEFCRRLSALPEEKLAGRGYRLPTEAEWEYACRAGTTTRWSFGDDESRLGDHAWFDGNSGNRTHPVGKKKPSAWGLFDMHGNVWEWCSDWYGDYAKGVVTDPQGPSGGSSRVLRGGGGDWSLADEFCRSATRARVDSSYRDNFLGFRLALSPSGEPAVRPEGAAGK